MDSSLSNRTPRSRITAEHGTMDEPTGSDRYLWGILFRLHRVPNQINSRFGRVELYRKPRGTHCNYRLEESSVLPSARWRWTMKQSCAHIAKIYCFCGFITPKPYVPHQLTHESRVLGMSFNPWNNSHCPKLWHLSCSIITKNTPSKVPILAVLRPVKPLPQKFGNFYRWKHAHTNSRLLFQKWSKSVQDKCPKVQVTKNKTRFGILRWNPWGDFP